MRINQGRELDDDDSKPTYRLHKWFGSRAASPIKERGQSACVAAGLLYDYRSNVADLLASTNLPLAGRPANVDETGWREGTKRGWLWVAVTASVTVFLIRLSRGRKVLAELIGGRPGVLATDRYPAYDHLPPDKRQVCWAHLRRDFKAMIDRRNTGSGVGDDLLMLTDILLMQWKRVRDGTLSRLLRAKGFRNILVHDYVAIDPDLLVMHLRDDAGDVWAFAQAVARWLKGSKGRE